MISPRHEYWRDALLLPGETDPVESGLRELADYFGISRDEARQRCLTALADSKREWESSARKTPDQIADFYRGAVSYLFEHLWWHVTDVETNSANVEIMVYARQLGAMEYLDFGSGIGANAILFARGGLRVTLADISGAMLDFARWRLARRGLAATYIDLNRSSLPAERFDLISAVDVFEHLPDPALTMRQLGEALRIGGHLVFNYRAGKDPERPMHLLPSARPIERAVRRSGLSVSSDAPAELGRLDLHVVERTIRDRSPLSQWWRRACNRREAR